MPDGYALALQAALVSSLASVPSIAELVDGRVYDEPPQGAVQPFLRLGTFVVRPVRSDCGSAATVDFSLEAHSRPNAGRVEATRCAEAIVKHLDGYPLAVAGYSTVTMKYQTQTVERNRDGKSYLAIVAFQTLLDG